MFVTPDRSRAYVYESDGTYLLGSRYLIEQTSAYTPQTTVWVTQRGTTPNSGTTTVTFGTPFLSNPLVGGSFSAQTVTLTFRSIVPTQFRSDVSGIGVATPEGTLLWWATGLCSSWSV